MQSAQESKQELQAAIRYAENAISSAKATIESMEFRQEMAKKQHFKQTEREEELTKLVKELEEANEKLVVDNYNLERELEQRISEVADLKFLNKSLKDANMSLVCDSDDLKDEVTDLKNEVEFYTKKYNELARQKEASSGSCGCQGYRDLEEEAARLKSDNLCLKASVDAASEHIKDMREELNGQIKLDEDVRQGVNDFLDFLDDIGYERA